MSTGIETWGPGDASLPPPAPVPDLGVPDESAAESIGSSGPPHTGAMPVGAAFTTTGAASTTTPASDLAAAIDDAGDLARALHATLSAVLLGTPDAVTTAVVSALSGTHLLIEDVPGVGKTVLARALAGALGAELSRVQGHPDLLPSDITGVTVFSPDTATWEFRPGPVFAHVVLLDEMNRTPPRTQSALLESMEEQQVSVDGESWPLPRPHLVIGTQNPVGQVGTYPLAESQLDRFGLSTSIGYPDAEIETRLVLHTGGRYALDAMTPVADTSRWERAIAATAEVHVVHDVAAYAVALVRATRTTGSIRLGASPRAAISLLRCAQAYAVLCGRSYVTPADVQAMAVACLSHRLLADGGEGAALLVGRIVADTPAPVT